MPTHRVPTHPIGVNSESGHGVRVPLVHVAFSARMAHALQACYRKGWVIWACVEVIFENDICQPSFRLIVAQFPLPLLQSHICSGETITSVVWPDKCASLTRIMRIQLAAANRGAPRLIQNGFGRSMMIV